MATRTQLLDALVEDSKIAKPDSVLGKLMNPLQELARAVRNPAMLLPKFKDLVEYAEKNFDAEMRGVFSGVVQRLVDEGVVTGPVWMNMIYALRRATDRDVLTRDARHAGLKKLNYVEKGVRKYFLYIPVLLVISDYERDANGDLVLDDKGKPKKRVVLPPEYVRAKADVSALFAKGAKVPVWKPEVANPPGWAAALPKYDRVPEVQVPLMLSDAIRFGAEYTCVFYMSWEDMIRIAPTLALNKRWEEGLPDKIRNHTFSMAEDVEKMVPDVGPGLGYVGPVQIAFKLVAMQMTSIMRSGDLFPTLPAKRQLMNPRHFSCIFRLARDYQFQDAAFPNGRNRCYLHCIDKMHGSWLLVSPLPHPFKKGLNAYRSMIIDSRLGLLRCCVEFIWVMGWGDPGAQRDFDAIIQFKRDVLDGMRDLASQIEDWRIDWAARRPGVKAEEEKKDTDDGYDQRGRTKNWCHRKFWLRWYHARLDRISERRVQELRLMAANNTLTITLVDTEWNNGFLGRHLTEARRREMFEQVYLAAYEVTERTLVMPAFRAKTLSRQTVTELAGKGGLYWHLPREEKIRRKGRLLVMADYCQFEDWAAGCVLNNARATDGHKELLSKEVARHDPDFMSDELVDRFHEIITRFYEHDKVAIDKVLKYIARRMTIAGNGGLGLTDKERSDIHSIILNAVGMGCGIEGLKRELSRLGITLVLDPAGEDMMMKVESTWRCNRLKELLELEEIWRLCGIDVEKENVSLTGMWLRLIKANDSDILRKMRQAQPELSPDGAVLETADAMRERLAKGLFHTVVLGWYEKNRMELLKEVV